MPCTRSKTRCSALLRLQVGEYRNLKGGDKYEPEEPADLLGWRGASRYYDPKYTAAFRLELKAVKKVREEFGLKNLNCMIPFCRTVDEAAKVTAIMKEEGLERGRTSNCS